MIERFETMNSNGNRTIGLVAVMGLVVAALSILAPTEAGAQGSSLMYACYMQRTGVVYRVNPPEKPGQDPNLRDNCTAKNHVKFYWVELVGVDGKVGIGVSNPTAALDVAGDIHASGQLRLGSNTMVFDGVANQITTGTNEDLAILPGGNGNVGIGTATPDYRLDVHQSVDGSFAARVSNPSSIGLGLSVETGNSRPDYMAFRTFADGVARFQIRNDGGVRMAIGGGNVGIGTDPTEKLTVAGRIHSTGGFKFPDGSVQTTAAAGGVSGWTRVESGTITIPPSGSNAIGTSTCPAGKKVVSGGFYSGHFDQELIASWPSADNVWSVWMVNHKATNSSLKVYAVCVDG
jgi:hypothetical protein